MALTDRLDLLAARIRVKFNSLSNVARTGNYSDLQNVPDLYSYFPISAEETADFATNNQGGFQFSYGNGNTGAITGIQFPFECELIALSCRSEGIATYTIEATINQVSTGKNVTGTANRGNNVNFENDPVTIVAGDIFNFRTTVGNNQTNGGTVTAWFRRKIN